MLTFRKILAFPFFLLAWLGVWGIELCVGGGREGFMDYMDELSGVKEDD